MARGRTYRLLGLLLVTTVACHRAPRVASANVSADDPVKQLAAITNATCARTAAGRVWCWGAIRTDEHDAPPLTRATRVPSVDDALDLVAATSEICILRPSGRTLCLGEHVPNAFDDEWSRRPMAFSLSATWSITPDGRVEMRREGAATRRFDEPHDAVRIAARQDMACVSTRRGDVWCGERVDDRWEMRRVDNPSIDHVVSIAADGERWCALRADATVACWYPEESRLAPGMDRDVRDLTGGIAGGLFAAQPGVSPGVMCTRGASGSWRCHSAHERVDHHVLAAPESRRDLHGLVFGAAHGCAITDRTARVVCWGSNGAGQLGNGESSRIESPRRSDGVSDVRRIVSFDEGFAVLTRAGEVYAFGEFTPSSIPRPLALRVLGTGNDDLFAAPRFVCARGGTPRTWQCAGPDPSAEWISPFSDPPITDNLASIDPGFTHAETIRLTTTNDCLRESNGHVACMQDEGTRSLRPIAGLGDDAIDLAAGPNMGCVRRAGRNVACWTPPLIGLGTHVTPGFIAREIADTAHVEAIAMSDEAWALRDDGAVVHWTMESVSPGGAPPSVVPQFHDAIRIAAGGHRACIVNRAARVECVRRTEDLFAHGALRAESEPPVALDDVVDVAPSRVATCAVRRDGSLWCWGGDPGDQLGLGVPAWRDEAVVVEIPRAP